MMRAIVLILCLTAAGGIAAYTQLSGGDSGEPVYTVRTHTPAAAPAPPPPAAAKPIDPSDRAATPPTGRRATSTRSCWGTAAS